MTSLKKWIAVSGLILICLPVWAQIQLSGIVKDSSIASALPGANVIIENTFYATQSDRDGKFVFKNLKPGKYTLKISYIGFSEYKKEIQLDVDQNLEINLSKKSYSTDEIVVFATRASAGAPFTNTMVSAEQLEKNNSGQDIPALLNQTPSVTVNSDAGTGIGYSGIRIRGSDPERINVTVNGIPVNDAESMITYFVDFPDLVSSTSDIQIQRGLGTSSNGAGAFGGSVNIKTESFHESAYAELNNSYGSFNTMKNTVKAGTGLLKSRFAFDARLSRTVSDGYIDRSFSDLKSFYVSGGYFGKRDLVKFIAFSGKEKTYQAWYGVPQDSLSTNPTFNPAGMYVDSDGGIHYYNNQTDNYIQDNYQLHYSHQFKKNRTFNLAFHYTKGKGYYEEYKQGELLSDYQIEAPVVGIIPVSNSDLIRQRWLDNDFYGSTFSYQFVSKHKFFGTMGGAWNRYSGKHFGEVIWAQFAGNSQINHRYYDDLGEKTEFNWFEKLGYRFTPKLKAILDMNWRYITYIFQGFDASLSPSQELVHLRFSNPKLGITYDFSSGKNLYAYFGRGSKEPKRDDYVQSSPNSRPKPEEMQNAELGYSHNLKNAAFAVNLYWMNYKNQLVLNGEINDVGAYNRTSVKKSYREGVEVQANVHLLKKINWKANATYSINKIENYSEFVDSYDSTFAYLGQVQNDYKNTDIAFSPSVISSSSLEYEPVKNLTFTLISKYVGEQYLDNTQSSSRKLDAYLTHDLQISYTIKPKWMREIIFTASAMNLFEEKYESNGYTYAYMVGADRIDNNYYYPQAGLMFFGGMILKF